MARLLERIRAWRQSRKERSAEPDKDWKTVGKTFRASDAVYDKTLPVRDDEGRPPH
jgi:hypothetical protein